MTDEKDTQAATDKTDDPSKTETEGSGEQEKKTDDLEASLKEFDAATESDDEQTSDKKADDDTKERLKRVEAELGQRVYREDLSKVVNAVRGDFSEDEVDDEFIDTWITAEAKKDSRVATAWMRRHEEPKKFAKVVAGLKGKFAEKHAKLRNIDEGATADREAVAHSVRRNGNKTSEGPPPKFGELSNREFQDDVKKKYGYTPRV